MKYKKRTKIFAILVIIFFLFTTFGTAILYLSTPKNKTQKAASIQPETVSTETGAAIKSGNDF